LVYIRTGSNLWILAMSNHRKIIIM
jgi:hypothetical protein